MSNHKDRGIKKWNPFKALEGQYQQLDDLLNKSKVIPRKVLSEDKCIEINNILSSLEYGDKILVSVYDIYSYKNVECEVLKIDIVNKLLITDEGTFPFGDIGDLQSL